FPIILRQIYNGVHCNQFSLPGGTFEPEDINLSYTAIRETVEEIGVEEENIEIIKQLNELYIALSNFLVYPFIGIHYGVPEFTAEERKDLEVIPLDMEDFLAAEPQIFDKSVSKYIVGIPCYK